MEDLERDIARSRAAFVGAAVTEIASFRAQLSGRSSASLALEVG